MARNKIPLQQYVNLLNVYLRPQRSNIVMLALLLIATIALQLVSPQFIRYFIDTVKVQGTMNQLFFAAVLFICTSLILQLVTVAATYIGENVGWIATNKLRGDVAEHCLKLDMSFHKTQTSGAIIERVDGDINALGNFFSSFVIHLLTNALLIAGIVILLFWENWIIGTGMAVFVLFALYAIKYVRKFAIPHWGAMRQISAEFYGFLGEHLEGTEDTRANGATGYVMHRFHSLLRRWLPIQRRAFMGWMYMWTTTIIVFTIGTAIAFALCYFLWRNGSMTVGTVYMVFFYTELMVKPIEKIRTQMEDLQKADASIVRVRELLATEPQIRDGIGTELSEGPLSVRFDRVTFGYEEEMTTLKDVHFNLDRGKVLGVLGRTGSGKTTLTRLLLRFYDVRSGGVYLGGVDVRDTKVAHLRSRVGLVTQNIELFQGTVRDNLTFYDESIEDVQIEAVLEDLGLGRWYHSLADGLDTVLESGGGGLSAGEAQLLAFARVFLSDPSLVVLDEASSRLDPATEQKMEEATRKLLDGRTCIIIAHRLTTVQRADDILILEDGRVVEHGPRAQLASNPDSRFSRFMATGLEEVPV
ncbi:ABC transporter ATP-binding protein [Paenibacillus tarimensis]